MLGVVTARVQVAGGMKVLNRSLKHLIPLEVRSMPSQQDTHAAQQTTYAAQQQPPQSVPAQRARRNAALIGELSRRDIK